MFLIARATKTLVPAYNDRDIAMATELYFSIYEHWLSVLAPLTPMPHPLPTQVPRPLSTVGQKTMFPLPAPLPLTFQ